MGGRGLGTNPQEMEQWIHTWDRAAGEQMCQQPGTQVGHMPGRPGTWATLTAVLLVGSVLAVHLAITSPEPRNAAVDMTPTAEVL